MRRYAAVERGRSLSLPAVEDEAEGEISYSCRFKEIHEGLYGTMRPRNSWHGDEERHVKCIGYPLNYFGEE